MRYISFNCHYIQMSINIALAPIVIHNNQDLIKNSAICYFNPSDILDKKSFFRWTLIIYINIRATVFKDNDEMQSFLVTVNRINNANN